MSVPAACKVCQAYGTPRCVQCPNEFSRWTRATCAFAWRWRLSLLWTGIFGTAAIMLAVAPR